MKVQTQRLAIVCQRDARVNRQRITPETGVIAAVPTAKHLQVSKEGALERTVMRKKKLNLAR
jgi:hypothetical protein